MEVRESRGRIIISLTLISGWEIIHWPTLQTRVRISSYTIYLVFARVTHARSCGSPAANRRTPGFHAGRTTGRHRDYCCTRLASTAGTQQGAGGLQSRGVSEQSASDQPHACPLRECE